MEKNSTFNVNYFIDTTEDQSFSLFDDEFVNRATVVIKDGKSTIFFENGEPEQEFSNFEDVIDFANEHELTFVKLSDGNNRWYEYNPNPKGKNIGDCTLRSYCAAFDIDWNTAFDVASVIAKENSSMIQYVADKVLTEHFNCTVDEKYNKKTVKGKDRITVNEFAMSHPYGTYILHIRQHQVTVKDGKYWDSWDSGKKKVDTVYNVPKK